MTTSKKVIIIGGPNGAGKTTFAHEYLPREAGCPVFVNVDLIAAGLSPFAPERAALHASRLMIEAMDGFQRRGESFAVETTLAARGYARRIPAWRAAGYFVKLIFLSLPNVEMAVARVAARVAQGGHRVPEAIIRRRYESGWRNFTETYRSLVDAWRLFDNSGREPVLIDEGGMP
jgi:predicted ABC-type ATPase